MKKGLRSRGGAAAQGGGVRHFPARAGTINPFPAARPRRVTAAIKRHPSASPRLHAILVAVLLATPVLADSNMPAAPLANVQLPDARQEAAAKALMETLRCLVCQGQSIADSNADLAGDMRSLVRQRIAAGERPEAVRAWLVRRYGDWVTYKPPLDSKTWLLWAAPILFVVLGGLIATGSLRRRRR